MLQMPSPIDVMFDKLQPQAQHQQNGYHQVHYNQQGQPVQLQPQVNYQQGPPVQLKQPDDRVIIVSFILESILEFDFKFKTLN